MALRSAPQSFTQINRSDLVVSKESIKNLLLDDIEVIRTLRHPAIDYFLVECKPKNKENQQCPSCMRHTPIHLHRSTDQPTTIRDFDFGTIQIDLDLFVPRYRCAECGSTFYHQFESIDLDRKMTKRLYKQIGAKSFFGPFSRTAQLFNYPVNTVINIFDSYVDDLTTLRQSPIAPTILGIFNRKIGKSIRTILMDIDTGSILDITSSCDSDSISNAIRAFENYHNNIETVLIEMNSDHRLLVTKIIPQARIIVDKRAVVEYIRPILSNTQSTIIRRFQQQHQEANSSSPDPAVERILSALRRDHYLFSKPGKHASRDALLADFRRVSPEFNHYAQICQEWEQLYNCTEVEDAETQFRKWQTLIPSGNANQRSQWRERFNVTSEVFNSLNKLSKTLEYWKNEIFNSVTIQHPNISKATASITMLNSRIATSGDEDNFHRIKNKLLFWDLAQAPAERYTVCHNEGTSPPIRALHGDSTTLSFLLGFVSGYYYIQKEKTDTISPFSVYSYFPKNYSEADALSLF